jgi:hypothetical protein
LDLRLDEAERRAGLNGGTPRTIQGPLYVAGAPIAKGEARLDDGTEDGEVLFMEGQVRDIAGKPVGGAIVDVWHANTMGSGGFAPELARIDTLHGEKLADPLCLRPTSETVIYDDWAKKVRSITDLPILINQWGNADDAGLVLPPQVAPTQAVVLTIEDAKTPKANGYHEAVQSRWTALCERVSAAKPTAHQSVSGKSSSGGKSSGYLSAWCSASAR